MQIQAHTNITKTNQLSFKGYCAAPLKQLFFRMPDVNKTKSDAFIKLVEEVSNVGKREGFSVFLQAGKELFTNFADCINKTVNPTYFWLQDTCTIFHNKKMFIQSAFDIGEEVQQSRGIATFAAIKAKDLKMDMIPGEIAGGNFFIGKTQNKKLYAIVGENCLKEKTHNELSRLLEVDYLYSIPQMDYHIDLAIRPLKDKTVLITDDRINVTIIEEIIQRLESGDKKLNKTLIETYKKYLKEFKKNIRTNEKWKKTANIDETACALSSQGFKVIRVPGRGYTVAKTEKGRPIELKYDFNFMNAIVHENAKGELTYITNRAPANLEIFNRVFRNYVKDVAPDIKEVVFVSGGPENFLANLLKRANGGIHCLASEVPDFEKWLK